MFTKKFTKVFTLVIICIMGTVVSVLAAAWGNDPEAPYQGWYTYWTTSGPNYCLLCLWHEMDTRCY